MNKQDVTKNFLQIGLKTCALVIPLFIGWLCASLFLKFLGNTTHLTVPYVSLTQVLTVCIGAYIGIGIVHCLSLGSYNYQQYPQTPVAVASAIGSIVGSFIVTLVYAFITT